MRQGRGDDGIEKIDVLVINVGGARTDARKLRTRVSFFSFGTFPTDGSAGFALNSQIAGGNDGGCAVINVSLGYYKASRYHYQFVPRRPFDVEAKPSCVEVEVGASKSSI